MPGQASKENGKMGGRPKGRKNDATLEKERELNAVKQRIMRNAQRIIDSQLSLSQGQQFLYRIDTNKKGIKSKPVLITDSEKIADYLDGEFGSGESLNTETEYYFITTKEPNNMAADSMLNRAFGKPTENMELTGKDGQPLFLPSEIMDKYNLNDKKSNKGAITDSK